MPELQPAFLGVEADVDWDEEGQEWTKELHQQIDEGIPPSDWQKCQIDQVIRDFPDVFMEVLGKAKGVTHWIVTPPGMVVCSPSQPTSLALQDTLEKEVQTML